MTLVSFSFEDVGDTFIRFLVVRLYGRNRALLVSIVKQYAVDGVAFEEFGSGDLFIEMFSSSSRRGEFGSVEVSLKNVFGLMIETLFSDGFST